MGAANSGTLYVGGAVAPCNGTSTRVNSVEDAARCRETSRGLASAHTEENLGARIAKRVSDFFTNVAPIRYAGAASLEVKQFSVRKQLGSKSWTKAWERQQRRSGRDDKRVVLVSWG